MKYPLYETFYTWQGEGVHLGRAAYFVRLYGCPQKCIWCDSAGTWHAQYRPVGLQVLSADDLAQRVVRNSPTEAIVVITGGEPILFDLEPLTVLLKSLGRSIHLETSGIAPLRGHVDWLTLSPKPFGMPPLSEIVARADEAKIVVHQKEDIARGLEMLEGLPETSPIWLHPEWSRARERDWALLDSITQAVKERPRLRAGFQMHKLYRADDIDPDSEKRQIPLGGNPDLGF
ncbi:MAG: 7-carboxy-7-deazaguanine synthase QueE [Deinococcaceae bacterium]